MSVAVLYATRNSKDLKDATGAFIPEAMTFCKVHEVPVKYRHGFDNEKAMVTRRKGAQSFLESLGTIGNPLDAVAFFCHGWKNGIQVGYQKDQVSRLVEAMIKAGATKEVKVIFYACDAARDLDKSRWDDVKEEFAGDGGFADTVRDELCAQGLTECAVFAHCTRGHTTTNPYWRVFRGDGSPVGGKGGQYIVSPGSKMWSEWKRQLCKTHLRFQYPFMPTEELYCRLTQPDHVT
jgi:hypothetical protein